MAAWNSTYRPQTIADLDSAAARLQLEKIISSGKIPHSLLFTGPKGIGKTSAARIFAKVLDCESNADKINEPCNHCSQCVSITNGSHLDVLEIDAASNRGIDDIRELRERVKLSPSLGKYRIYIIDEVHMLTTEAFNALLKTLEEPPAHVVFILCTTDPQKLPETIVSRCTRIIFKQATREEVLGKLEKIVKNEKLEIEKGTLELLVHGAGGSFRDAVKLLEQISAGGKVIKIKDVNELLGQVEASDPQKLIEILFSKDTKTALLEISSLVANGVNLKTYIENLVEILRTMLLGNFGITDPENSLPKMSPLPATDKIDKLIRLLNNAYNQLKDAIVPQLPLELAVVEWFSDFRSGTANEIPETTSKSVPTPILPPNPIIQTVAAEKSSEEKVISGSVIDFDQVSGHWQEVMQKIKPKNTSVEALLRACQPISIEKGHLILEVYYKFHKDRLESDKYRRVVEDVISEVLGIKLQLKYKLGEKASKAIAGDTPTPGDDISGKPVEDEIINAAAEIFKGSIVE